MCCLRDAAPAIGSDVAEALGFFDGFWYHVRYTCVGTSLKLCWPVVTVSVIVLAPVQLSGTVTLAVFCTKLLFSALYFPCKAFIRQKFPSLPLSTKSIKRNKFKMRAGAGIC